MNPDPTSLSWLALSLVSGLGPKTLNALLQHFSSVEALLQASPQDLTHAGTSASLAERISRAKETRSFMMERRLLEESKEIRLLCPESSAYPRVLQEIASPPLVLYWTGSLQQIKGPCIAFVGSRTCGAYGRQQTRRLIEELSQVLPEVTIVSGLARGVDTVAHEVALEQGLPTIAVLAGGLQHLYPPENAGLAEAIKQQGALISEFPLALRPVARNFPIRNRVISGLSQAVVVTEARARSGALITAAFALQQNREVFALPGRVDAPASEGPNALIARQQARLIRHAQDLLEELPHLRQSGVQQPELPLPTPKHVQLSELSEPHQAILKALNSGIEEVDRLHVESQVPMAHLLSALIELELMGYIQPQGGQRYRLEPNLELVN